MIYTQKEVLELVEKQIQNLPLDRNPKQLYEPIRYIMSLGGKRIRPVLTLMSANLFKEDLSEFVKTAVALEIFHNFTLLHDDVMDKADIRRGKPTAHKKWNDNVAILSGDAMLIESYKYIAEIPDTKLRGALNLFSQTAMEVCEGQQYDMEFENRLDVNEEEYMEMIRLKTAVLLACALKMGSILGGTSAKDSDLLYNFGINIGLAFQLQDDLLDVYGDPAVFGKNIGGDIVSNKKTFLLIKALELSSDSQRNDLNNWIAKKDFAADEKIKSVKAIYESLHLKELSEKKIEEYFKIGIQNLEEVSVDEDRKNNLIQLAHSLMYRDK